MNRSRILFIMTLIIAAILGWQIQKHLGVSDELTLSQTANEVHFNSGDSAEAQDTTTSNTTSAAELSINEFVEWIAPEERRRLPISEINFEDQFSNTGTLGGLLDRPTIIAFFYTRCTNARKCSTTIGQCAAMQRLLEGSDLANQYRMLMVTYEPQFDTPQQMLQYASSRQVSFNDNVRMLRLVNEGHERLIDALQVPVSYNGGWVNLHGVSLYLLDAEGRLASIHHTTMWNLERVFADLKKISISGR